MKPQWGAGPGGRPGHGEGLRAGWAAARATSSTGQCSCAAISGSVSPAARLARILSGWAWLRTATAPRWTNPRVQQRRDGVV